MVIFYVQAVSSISLTVRSVSALCRVRKKAVSDLHRGLVGRCCQSQPPLWVSCALAWAPLLLCALLGTPRALVFQGRCP